MSTFPIRNAFEHLQRTWDDPSSTPQAVRDALFHFVDAIETDISSQTNSHGLEILRFYIRATTLSSHQDLSALYDVGLDHRLRAARIGDGKLDGGSVDGIVFDDVMFADVIKECQLLHATRHNHISTIAPMVGRLKDAHHHRPLLLACVVAAKHNHAHLVDVLLDPSMSNHAFLSEALDVAIRFHHNQMVQKLIPYVTDTGLLIGPLTTAAAVSNKEALQWWAVDNDAVFLGLLDDMMIDIKSHTMADWVLQWSGDTTFLRAMERYPELKAKPHCAERLARQSQRHLLNELAPLNVDHGNKNQQNKNQKDKDQQDDDREDQGDQGSASGDRASGREKKTRRM